MMNQYDPLDTNFDRFMSEWINALHVQKICPYAKNTLEQELIKTVKVKDADLWDFWSAVAKECEDWNGKYHMVAVAMNTNEQQINQGQLQGGVDSLNSSLNVRNKGLWLLEGLHQNFTTVFIQDIIMLDDASKILEKQDYYKNTHPFRYWKTIESRRKLRNKLTIEKGTT
jgi:hypothetical protein